MYKVATLIANHNYAKYLDAAIQSALNQTYPNFVIVVDDCSTDGSRTIAMSILKPSKMHKQQDIEYHVGEKGMLICLPKNMGPSIARNIGILSTIKEFDYYQILDADDIMYPNKIEKLLSVMDDKVGVAYADYDQVNIKTGTVIREYKEDFSLKRLREECIVHSGSLVNKNALLAVLEGSNIYDPNRSCAEDYLLWTKLCKK